MRLATHRADARRASRLRGAVARGDDPRGEAVARNHGRREEPGNRAPAFPRRRRGGDRRVLDAGHPRHVDPQLDALAVLYLMLAAAALLYARGVHALWRSAGLARGIRRAHAARFALGWLALVVALASPLDSLAESSFAAHMAQHELLMALAAPLLVLGRPLEAWAWALPQRWLR